MIRTAALAWLAVSAYAQTPSPTVCVDNEDYRDDWGDSCASYYNDNPGDCNPTVAEHCCICNAPTETCVDSGTFKDSNDHDCFWYSGQADDICFESFAVDANDGTLATEACCDCKAVAEARYTEVMGRCSNTPNYQHDDDDQGLGCDYYKYKNSAFEGSGGTCTADAALDCCLCGGGVDNDGGAACSEPFGWKPYETDDCTTLSLAECDSNYQYDYFNDIVYPCRTKNGACETDLACVESELPQEWNRVGAGLCGNKPDENDSTINAITPTIMEDKDQEECVSECREDSTCTGYNLDIVDPGKCYHYHNTKANAIAPGTNIDEWVVSAGSECMTKNTEGIIDVDDDYEEYIYYEDPTPLPTFEATLEGDTTAVDLTTPAPTPNPTLPVANFDTPSPTFEPTFACPITTGDPNCLNCHGEGRKTCWQCNGFRWQLNEVKFCVRVTTNEPTEDPTSKPTAEPTFPETEEPTAKPTETPTDVPTARPTEDPTSFPTHNPTQRPSDGPTEEPTAMPTSNPTVYVTDSCWPYHHQVADAMNVYIEAGKGDHCYGGIPSELEFLDPALIDLENDDFGYVLKSGLGHRCDAANPYLRCFVDLLKITCERRCNADNECHGFAWRPAGGPAGGPPEEHDYTCILIDDTEVLAEGADGPDAVATCYKKDMTWQDFTLGTGITPVNNQLDPTRLINWDNQGRNVCVPKYEAKDLSQDMLDCYDDLCIKEDKRARKVRWAKHCREKVASKYGKKQRAWEREETKKIKLALANKMYQTCNNICLWDVDDPEGHFWEFDISRRCFTRGESARYSKYDTFELDRAYCYKTHVKPQTEEFLYILQRASTFCGHTERPTMMPTTHIDDSAVSWHTAKRGTSSCDVTCFHEGLVCARDEFGALGEEGYHRHPELARFIFETAGAKCKEFSEGGLVIGLKDSAGPLYDRRTKTCILRNKDSTSDLCSAVSYMSFRRVCPCKAA